MVDNLEIKTPDPQSTVIRNIMPQLLNDTTEFGRRGASEIGLKFGPHPEHLKLRNMKL